MTAEIALINQSAVTLAADSAVTLPSGKIFNTADKIFELSVGSPIGAMVYNSLGFMGLPIDVLIKQFRDSAPSRQFVLIAEAAECLFDFLVSLEVTRAHEMRHVANVLTEEFSTLIQDFNRKFFQTPREGRGRYDLNTMFTSHLSEWIDRYRAKPITECLWEYGAEDVIATYGDAVKYAIRVGLRPFPYGDDHIPMLEELAAMMILRDHYSGISTGFVVAGYGVSDLLPSLISFETDGMFFGRIKRKASKTIIIDRTSGGAQVVPFAQHEMVDRFLDGIDPEFESAISRLLSDVLRKTSNSIVDGVPRMSKRRREDLRDKAIAATAVAVADFENAVSTTVKGQFREEILAMVSGMPKPDLANFAEALVNITSIKRKVSAQEESVAGPIDVAVISRAEGFVWVKRKHYFDPTLNPRYFQRKYGSLPAIVSRRE